LEDPSECELFMLYTKDMSLVTNNPHPLKKNSPPPSLLFTGLCI
jgi:hypothetical protein